ncbi:MAG: glutathione S-transferase family protein, partial [Pseudomonadota bacterium]
MNDMSPKSIRDYVADANRPLTNPDLNRPVGAGHSRFEVYHFGLSVCSQKVRMALYEKGAAFMSHDVNIFPPINENYHPDYVRLRLQGGRGRDMVGGYTGRSSTTSEGFDPCVVPTLVDMETEEVIVDSTKICAHVDRVHEGGTELLPARLKSEIEREIAIVDTSPHPAILYGAHPDGDYRPKMLHHEMPGIHDRKIMKLMEARSLSVGHPRLVAAYDAKIRKEAAAKSYVTTPDMMRSAVDETVALVAALDARLSDGRAWICGDAFTMADIQWAISLFRFKWLGMAFVWEGGHALNATPHPHVEAYAARLFARPSFVEAVLKWPTNPPTEYVMDHYDAPE